MRSLRPLLLITVTAINSGAGTAYRYANVNYVLAGRLVEVVTGRSSAEHLRAQQRPRPDPLVGGGTSPARAPHPVRAVLGLLRLFPFVIMALLLPPLAGRLVDVVDMTWSMLTYYSLTPLVTVLTVGLASAAVLAARLASVRRSGHGLRTR